MLALFVKARFAYAGDDERRPVLPVAATRRQLRAARLQPVPVLRQQHVHGGDRASLVCVQRPRDGAVPGRRQVRRRRRDTSTSPDLNYSGGIGLRVRVRDAVVMRMDVATSREGTRWIWSHERRVAEAVLVAARRLPPCVRAARVLALLAAGDRHRPRRGGSAEVLSGRPAGARAGAAARARSRGSQFQRASRGRDVHGEPPGRTASRQAGHRGSGRQYAGRRARQRVVRESSRPHAHERGGAATRQRDRSAPVDGPVPGASCC